MVATIKPLVRNACVVTTLICMAGIAMAQTRVEPEQPRWGQTLTIINYHIIPEAGEFIIMKMGISAFPTHIVVGQEGQVEAIFTGGGEKRPRELRQLISRLLGGK